ncbi:low temperature requirement protein A [Paenibacillus sp. 1001270B_150601_E10]|uniref:low temperature requirement protein A n=1 Tax=Paenibacillus sp. 1001270B_150601_E10 TaxID=2787079 RepID=UPI0018A02589|nr:low temperature requirement protein A [Paenibacillus sp. 1001270B_150601_E10]
MEERKVSWLELFFDLVFVAAISSTNHLLLTIGANPDKSLVYFFEYLLMVTPMWWAWVGQTMFFNRFGLVLPRPQGYMLAQMMLLIIMTASFNLDFDETYYTFLIAYLGIRGITIIEYFSVSRAVCPQEEKEVAGLLGRLFLVGFCLSLPSLFFSGWLRYLIMYIGIAVDIALPLVKKERLKRMPVDLPHLAERFGLLVIIALGEIIVSIISILSTDTTNLKTLMFSIVAFLIVCLMWWGYYEGYEKVMSKEKRTNGQILLYGHYFIMLAIMLLAADIHLIYEGHASYMLEVNLLFGAAAMFYMAKHSVLVYHKKDEVRFGYWKSIWLLIGTLIAYATIVWFMLPLYTALGWVMLFLLLDAVLHKHNNGKRP